MKSPAHERRLLLTIFRGSRRHHAEPDCEFELSLELSLRAECDTEVMQVRRPRMPAVPFSDVRWNRNGRPAHLLGEAELLAGRKRICEAIGDLDKAHRVFPHLEIAM